MSVVYHLLAYNLPFPKHSDEIVFGFPPSSMADEFITYNKKAVHLVFKLLTYHHAVTDEVEPYLGNPVEFVANHVANEYMFDVVKPVVVSNLCGTKMVEQFLDIFHEHMTIHVYMKKCTGPDFVTKFKALCMPWPNGCEFSALNQIPRYLTFFKSKPDSVGSWVASYDGTNGCVLDPIEVEDGSCEIFIDSSTGVSHSGLVFVKKDEDGNIVVTDSINYPEDVDASILMHPEWFTGPGSTKGQQIPIGPNIQNVSPKKKKDPLLKALNFAKAYGSSGKKFAEMIKAKQSSVKAGALAMLENFLDVYGAEGHEEDTEDVGQKTLARYGVQVVGE